MKTIVTIFIAVIILQTIGHAQEPITKDDVKKLQQSLSKELIIKPDYFEKEIWVLTPKISTLGKVGALDDVDKTHEFYFRVTKNKNGDFVRDSLRYRFYYKASNWLFINKIVIRTAKTNQETREGLGTEYIVDLSKDKTDRQVGGGVILEKFDIYNNESINKWVRDVAATGNFSRLRIYGGDSFVDEAIKNKGFQLYAIAIVAALDNDTFK
jgi:hypothetical protein